MARKRVDQKKMRKRGELKGLLDAACSVYSIATRVREDIVGDIAEAELDDNALHRLSVTLARLIEIQTLLKEYLPDNTEETNK